MKALGITALVLAIISIFIPGFSLYITWLALFLVAIAAFSSEATLFVVLTIFFAAINLLFLSPLVLTSVLAIPLFLFITLGLFTAPMLIMALRQVGMIAGSSIKVLRT